MQSGAPVCTSPQEARKRMASPADWDRDNLAVRKVYALCARLPSIAGRENIRLDNIALAARPGHNKIAGSSDVSRSLRPSAKNGPDGRRDADTRGLECPRFCDSLPSRSRASAIACLTPSSSSSLIGVIRTGSDLSLRHGTSKGRVCRSHNHPVCSCKASWPSFSRICTAVHSGFGSSLILSSMRLAISKMSFANHIASQAQGAPFA